MSLGFAAEILESITDAFFTLDREWRFTFLNSAITPDAADPGRADQVIWDKFPTMAEGAFRREFQRILSDGCKVSFEEIVLPTGTLLSLNA